MNITNVSNICIISPSLKLGGIERALTTLAKEFCTLGHNVVFISCLNEKPFYTLSQNIKVLQPSFNRNASLINKLSFYVRLLFYIRHKVNSIKPSAVLVYGDWFSPLSLLALYGTKHQIFISDRTHPEYRFKFPIPQLKKWLYPRSAGFIAQTMRAKDHKLKVFGNKLRVEVIPNALPEFIPNEVEKIRKENKLIYVGRFAWEKDPEILIRAMKYVAVLYPHWVLEMAGSGPLIVKMQSLVLDLGIENQVKFLGNVKNVAKLYQSSSFLILPSVVEGFPNTLIEAMSFGLPTICFEDIPYEDIIEHNINGFVVKGRSPRILANSITKLIEDNNLRNTVANNARKSVEKYHRKFVTQQILTFMEIK